MSATINRKRIMFDIVIITMTFMISFLGIYYFLHKIFDVSKESIVSIFIPTAIVGIIALTYGYTKGFIKKYKIDTEKKEGENKVLFPIFLSGTFSLTFMVVGMYLCISVEQYVFGVSLILLAVCLSIFSYFKSQPLFS